MQNDRGSGAAEDCDDLVTVVIPARDEETSIDACLQSVRAQSHRQLEILVVDNDSRDATASIVRRHAEQDDRVKLLHLPRPSIPSALNHALAHAQGTWLVRIDAHSSVDPEYVARAVRRLREGRWGGVGGRKDGVGVTPAGRAIAAAMASRFGVGGSRYHYGTRTQEVEHVAFGAYPADLLRSVGGWDERISVNEDFELDHRLRLLGRPLLFDPELVIRWQCRQSIDDLYRQYRRYGRGKVMVALKHPTSMRPRHVLPPAFVAYLIGVALLLPQRPGRAMALVAPYLVALAAATAVTGRTLNESGARIRVPAAFVAMHVGWGVGFWQGVAGVARSHMGKADNAQGTPSGL
jgi:succinoglycan biosynthesis protein ExoA